jgi:hypothetical protein
MHTLIEGKICNLRGGGTVWFKGALDWIPSGY